MGPCLPQIINLPRGHQRRYDDYDSYWAPSSPGRDFDGDHASSSRAKRVHGHRERGQHDSRGHRGGESLLDRRPRSLRVASMSRVSASTGCWTATPSRRRLASEMPLLTSQGSPLDGTTQAPSLRSTSTATPSTAP